MPIKRNSIKHLNAAKRKKKDAYHMHLAKTHMEIVRTICTVAVLIIQMFILYHLK